MADYLKATVLRKGMYISLDNEIWCIMDMTHITPGKGRAHVQTKLRSVKVGNQTEHRFRSDEQVERVRLDEVEMEYLYQDGDDYHFMNTATYDQVHIHKDALGDRVAYLTPNMKLTVITHDGNALDIIMPPTIDVKIIDTAPEIKGATASAQRKPAECDNGLTVQVPSFVGPGEMIRVSTEDGSYVERVK